MLPSIPLSPTAPHFAGALPFLEVNLSYIIATNIHMRAKTSRWLVDQDQRAL